MSRQLALPFPARVRHGVFLPDPANEAALAWLDNPGSWPSLRLAVYGAAGCGKTHLLHQFVERTGGVFFPGEAIRQLVDLPDDGTVAIDDASSAAEPEALLHVLNMAAERGLPLLLAGQTAPAHWPAALPDLASRLRSVAAVELGQPGDELLRALFAQLIAQRQLSVDEGVQNWLLARLPRDGHTMREAASCLDRMSLAAGSRVTRAMAAALVRRFGGEDEDLATAAQSASCGMRGLI